MVEAKIDLDVPSLHIVQAILRRHVPDRPVYAFGSRVRGRARRRSDLDLAIGGAEPLTLGMIADLKEEFSDSDLPIFVDVVDIHTLEPGFLTRIEHDFIPLNALSDARD